MNIKELTSKLKGSFKILKDNRKVLMIGIIAELLFFTLYSFFTSLFSGSILSNLEQLGGEVISGSPETGEALLNIATGSQYSSKIITLSIIIAVIVYLLYCSFQGFIWKFCFNLENKKGKYLPYIKKFFLVMDFSKS